MALISNIIGPQAYELIRDRIAVILASEIANQSVLGSNVENATVWAERFIPFDLSEFPAVNVTTASGNFSGQTLIQANGAYIFNIDCYAKAPSSDGDDGDALASIKLQRLIGVIRAILSDSKYKTLLFDPPFISSRNVQSLSFANPVKGDSESTAMGRITFEVKATETVEILNGVIAQLGDTQVKLALTNKGYKYVYLGSSLFITPDSLTADVDLNANTITIPYTFGGIDPSGKLVVLVSSDGGITYVENSTIGEQDLVSPLVVAIGSGGVAPGIYFFKLKSVDNPLVVSDPIYVVAQEVISSFTAGVSTISIANNGGDDWDIGFKITPDSNQLPTGYNITKYAYSAVFYSAGSSTPIEDGDKTINYTLNASGNGAGVYELACDYTASNGLNETQFFTIRLVKVDGTGNILANVELKGIMVNSVTGLVMSVTAIIVQTGVSYAPQIVTVTPPSTFTVLGAGATATVTVPTWATNIGVTVPLDSVFTTDYPKQILAGATIEIS